jgi:hypothetical protein
MYYVALNGMKQIYSPHFFTDCTSYRKPYRKFLKKQLHVPYLEEHHIFPKSLKNHPALANIDINCGKNLKIMPNNRSNVSSIILKHGPHPAYNRYVKKHLDRIYFDMDEENRRYQLYLLLHDLEQKLNFGELPF